MWKGVRGAREGERPWGWLLQGALGRALNMQGLASLGLGSGWGPERTEEGGSGWVPEHGWSLGGPAFCV